MKTIKNEVFKIGKNEISYKEQIISCLNFQTPEGLDYQGIKIRNKIEEVIEKSNGTIDLEDADAEALKEIVKKVRWSSRDKGLQTFIETINDL